MEEIASSVGITAAALYRHFPNKYALFAECANVMVDRLIEAVDDVPAEAALTDDVLAVITRVTVANRASGAVYRWQDRYLNSSDREGQRGKFARVIGRVTDAMNREHPLPDEQLRANAALGAIGSITLHGTSIAQRRAEDLLLAAATRVSATDPSAGIGSAPLIELPAEPVPRTRRAEILAAAIPLFERDGFATVTNGRIAEAVGLVPSRPECWCRPGSGSCSRPDAG